jgi:hypothetical protein
VAWLVITEDDGTERVVELGTGNLRIGRGAGNDIVLPDARKGVSRAHAELRFEDGHYVIVDLQSQNGTWLNGQRVQRAEVPPDAEITLGTYRLRCQDGPRPGTGTVVVPAPAPAQVPAARPAAASAPPAAKPAAAESAWPDVVISRAGSDHAGTAAPPAQTARRSPGSLVPALVVAALAVLVVAVWQFGFRSSGGRSDGAEAPSARPAEVPASPPAPAGVIPAPPSDRAPATVVAEPPVVPEPAAPTAAPAAAAKRTPPAARAAMPPVPRRPNESVDAWRTRIAALEARYEYSKAALDRGDFGSAASGFDAILREEPGFLDAPALLVQARSGLRAAALDVLAAGNRLDAAGDWFGALQQYERVREVDPGTPGLDAAVKRVREKLRVAGQEAFDRGREFEKLGRPAAALQEYEKAVQWLPSDDPARAAVVARMEQLRISARD